jgi:UDP-glucuronate 4-epimerase
MIGWIETGLSASGKTVKARIDQRPASKADMAATWADISKAKRLLDWSPVFPPEEGYEHAIRWFLSHQSWAAKLSI